ncbi:hypothetical protein U0F71_06685 [Burkholderia pseudomallei]|uniref:hypothetical protein n=1 Tax=Burkholderia pseudomallei TaxID=28450 RepID=UPI002AB3B953|nr:hypothetical protein [Burkholderia pseudomallei]MDY7815400.1 hypothetical protein [Burkholderia pseudomallei]MDY7862039.1 hypothetical protein [Burkholderia pseudomallei]
MSDGVFASVPCALAIAYRMPAYIRSPESACARIMRDRIRKSRVWDRERLLPKVVFFDGLTNEQIHSQCGRIRDTVGYEYKGKDIPRKPGVLPEFEAATIRARYGFTEVEDIKTGERRFAFSPDRNDAIKTLSTKMRIEFDILSEGECDWLIARIFANVKKTTPITLRAIAEQFGRSHVHYHNYYHAIDDRLYHLEMRALDVLTDVFADRGTCGGEPVVAAREHYASGQ